MADVQYYERVFKAKKPSASLIQKILLISAYAIILALWLIIVLAAGLSASLLMLIPLLLLTVSLLTWKYTSEEYEYSFVAGSFTFSKIYGSSRRKTVFEAELKSLISVVPYSERAEADTKADKLINATVPAECPRPCICVFEENERKHAVIIDCDDMTLKILRYYKPSLYFSFNK